MTRKEIHQTQEDFKARVSMAYEGREQWEAFLDRVWLIHTSELPRWISVADELPRCNIPYTNWDGSPSDVMESERVVALIDNGEVCIATLNQNIDEDTKEPAGEPYWFAEGKTEDGGWIAERVTHWMPMPALPMEIRGNQGKNSPNQQQIIGTIDHIKTALEVMDKKGGEQ